MEFVRGETLMEWRVKLYKSALLDSAVQIVSKVASALDFAHDKGILHRDIKPGNIIVYWNRDKQSIDVKVLDFGLASAMKEVFQRLECHPNEMAGTLPYMAPEQWRMEKLGVGTDIYALAVVAHQFVFYTIPNEDVFKSGNLSAMYRRVCEEDVKFADKIWPEMKRVLERGMAKKVRDRYFSCCEFAQDFATAIKAFPAPLTKNLDVDWRKEGNVLKHPLVKRLSELNFQCHHIDHLISGFVGDYEMDKFWNYLAILIRNITPYRLTHANEVLSLDFSVDKNKEEQVVSDVAEKVRADIASRYLEWAREEKFRAAWSSLIDWAKLMGEVLVTYPWDSEGVLECMKALKVQIDKLEEKERMKNVTIGGKTFIGNPFYRKKLTPEIILCDYYIEMGSR